MLVNRFGHYVTDQVFRAADDNEGYFGFHLLVPILDIWPHQAAP